MTITVTHAKVNQIPDPTQADVDAQIALGNLPAGTTLADLTLHSDWNATHVFSGTLEQSQNNVAVDGVTITGDGTPGNPLVASASSVEWGDITGTLSNQTDLQAALDDSAASVAIGGDVTSGTAGSVLFVGAGPVLAQDASFTWDSSNDLLTLTSTGTGGLNGLRINNNTAAQYAGIGFNSNNSQIAELNTGFANGALVGPAFGTFSNSANGLAFAAYNATGVIDFITGGLTTAERRMRIQADGNVGIGTVAPDKALEINHATGQCLRLTYNDASGSAATYCDATIASDGVVTFNAEGSSPGFVFSDDISASNLSGTNTGDQTSIVGITGTKAEFDTAVTDGNFLYVGDVTQYTDEMAQDATGAMVTDGSLVYVDATPLLTRGALTGDITASQGSNTTTLATVNANVGSFTNASLTVNGKGLITAASSGTAPVTSVSGTSNRITSTGGATPVIDISASYVGQSSITTVGTISTGTWSGLFGAVSGANLTNINAATVTVADAASDTTTFLLLGGSATGNLPVLTDAGLAYNASTNVLTGTGQFVASSFSPSSTSGIIGTTTNDDAAAGSVGEYISSSVASGSAVSMTSPNAANITSISLTAGDWDVEGFIQTVNNGATVMTVLVGSVNSTSATTTNAADGGTNIWRGSLTGLNLALPTGARRFSLASTTTIYLVALATFTTSTCTVYGSIRARRVR